jgi:hypothetical protein
LVFCVATLNDGATTATTFVVEVLVGEEEREREREQQQYNVVKTGCRPRVLPLVKQNHNNKERRESDRRAQTAETTA